jgi:hypothetical protein
VECTAGGDLDLFLFADSRAAAAKRARRLGIHGVRLQSKGTWIADEDVNAVLASEAGAVWRRNTDGAGQYRSIKAWPLKRRASAARTPPRTTSR